MDCTIVKNYRNDDKLRASFNRLVQKTFGFDFSQWYENGYWNENYIPYSILSNGEIIANVSVNLTEFCVDGRLRMYIQLGTVMTDEKFRNKGLIRTLMKEIDSDFQDKCDGMYLFANAEVVNFYPKFGFVGASETQYSRKVSGNSDCSAKRILMETISDWEKLVQALDVSIENGSFEMIGNSDLIMFYVTSFMKDCVYYIEPLDTYVIAEIEDSELLIHKIISKKVEDIHVIAGSFGSQIKKVRLGFTPFDTQAFDSEIIYDPDTILFVRGAELADFSKMRKMFPTLSHA